MHLGLIGYGSIARALVGLIGPGVRVTALVRPGAAGPDGAVTSAAALIAAKPDLVVECAGHAAVRDHATACLRAGFETVIVSIGALADAALEAEVIAAAEAGQTRAILPAGAIGGVDLLSALRPSGISEVTYTGRKPPLAWTGTPAERVLDLAALTEAAVFFEGSAREAALAYPKNANVAATLALAGIGFDETRVRLVADPGVTQNVHEYRVRSGAADYSIAIAGHPSPENPKTSAATALSVAREVQNRQRRLAI